MKKDNRPRWAIIASSIVALLVSIIQLITNND